MLERMKISQILWKNNISAEFSHLDNPKFKKQLDESLERGIPFMVVFGEDEVARGVVKIKDMKNHVEIEIPTISLVDELKKMGCRSINAAGDVGFIELLKQNNISSAEGVN
jgi:histidyl-tRNA synthetase